MDALAYTRSELEKQLELLQIHLTQHERLDFCLDCVRKHWAAIEGLSEEGMVFTKSPREGKLFKSMAIWAREWRNHLPRTDEAFALAYNEARDVRKEVVLSPLLSFPLNKQRGNKINKVSNSIIGNPTEKPIRFLPKPQGQSTMSMNLKEAAALMTASAASKVALKWVGPGIDSLAGKGGAPAKERPSSAVIPLVGAGLNFLSYFGMRDMARINDTNRAAQLGIFSVGADLLSHQLIDLGGELATGAQAGVLFRKPGMQKKPPTAVTKWV